MLVLETRKKNQNLRYWVMSLWLQLSIVTGIHDWENQKPSEEILRVHAMKL